MLRGLAFQILEAYLVLDMAVAGFASRTGLRCPDQQFPTNLMITSNQRPNPCCHILRWDNEPLEFLRNPVYKEEVEYILMTKMKNFTAAGHEKQQIRSDQTAY